MNAPTPLLEQRLRRGLNAAADAIPPVELTRGGRDGRRPFGPRPPRRTWPYLAVGSAAAVLVAAVALVATRDGDGSGPSDVVTETELDTAQTGQDDGVGPANGYVPGQAVVVDDELRTYGPDGAQTGAMSLAPLSDVQAVSSDLAGGWVACGLTSPPATGSGANPADASGAQPDEGQADPSDRAAREAAAEAQAGEGTGAASSLVWFPAGGEPTPLPSTATSCSEDAVQVVDAPEGTTAIYDGQRPFDPENPDAATGELHAVVLSTGEDRALDIAFDYGDALWAASTSRLLVREEAGAVRLFDLTTGDELPLADIAIDPSSSDLVLSPDAASAAWLAGDPMQDATDLVVVDLATGEERYRETFAMSLEGAQLSYDGTTVAVGNYNDGHDAVTYPPVAVFDLANPQDRYTIDVHGGVL